MDKVINTEINSIPENWELATIEAFCTVKSSSMSYKELDDSEGDDDGIRVFGIKVSDMNLRGNETSFQIANLERLINKEVAYKRAIPPNSVVFPKRGAAIATNKKRLTTCWTVLDPNLIAVMPSEEVNSTFLFYWFHTVDLARVTDPGPTPQLNRKDIAPLEFPKPPLGEQKKIAYVLSIVQQAIAQQEQIIQTTTELKKALMHKLFTEGLHGEKQKETAIGLIPESWSLATIDSLCSIKSSSITYQQLENLEDDENHESLTVFGVKVSDMNLEGNEVAFITANLIRKIGREIASKKAIPKNSIVFPKRGAAIATNKKRLTTCYTVLDPNLIAVVPLEKVDYRFLFHWFNTFDLAKITDPGPTPQLNKKDIAPLKFPFPEKEIQKKVADSIDAVDRKIEIHTKKLLTLTELFRALLHQLMTAQIRVHDIDLPGFDESATITPQGTIQGSP